MMVWCEITILDLLINVVKQQCIFLLSRVIKENFF
jgi:hypothetical protein